MMRWLGRTVAAILAALAIGILILVARTNPVPWSPADVRKLVTGLNEAAAIGVPHGFLMSAAERSGNLRLLERVEAGDALDEADSRAYRMLFQTALFENQRFLGLFDAELTVLHDHAMHAANNRQGLGIAGRHDHHDLSARLNFAGLLSSLDALKAAHTPFGRIVSADRAYKDLVDLISHMGVAPHTISVGYQPPDQPWPDAELGAPFEAMLKGFKDAQFAPVNTTAYWTAVDSALDSYARLILTVQARVMADTSVWERRIAGRFLSAQTLAPPVDLERPLRR